MPIAGLLVPLEGLWIVYEGQDPILLVKAFRGLTGGVSVFVQVKG